MILTVDIGNTTVCVCGVERRTEELTARFCTRLSTVHGKSAGEYAAELREALDQAGVAFRAGQDGAAAQLMPQQGGFLTRGAAYLQAMLGSDRRDAQQPLEFQNEAYVDQVFQAFEQIEQPVQQH